MMQLHPTPVSSAVFTHYPRSKTLMADSSDTNGLKPLYDDACDVGIAIRSERTGRVTYWHWSADVRCGTEDNELLEVTLRPTHETLRAFPRLEGYCVRLIND